MRVFDGYYSLSREILNEFDLFVCEWANFLTVDDKGAGQLAVFKHRNCDGRASAAHRRRWRRIWERGAVSCVGHLLRPPNLFKHGSWRRRLNKSIIPLQKFGK